MLLRFAICLAPALLAIVLLFLGMALKWNQDVIITLSLILIAVGAIISGVCVAKKVYTAMKEPVWAAWLLSIITFLCVGIAYLGVGLAGCCGAAIVTSS